MSVAKVTEICASSPTSFEDAIQKGIERADKTLDKVKGAWVSEMKVEVDDGKVTHMAIEENPGGLDVSSAEKVLAAL